MAFRFAPQSIPDVVLIEGPRFSDARGLFLEAYRYSEFAAGGIPLRVPQLSYSRSKNSVLRGLHYQMRPKAQAKLISVVRGEIFDVVVDLRRGSPAYGDWISVVLAANDHSMLYVPEGFAHGFCVLSDEADVLYALTAEHDLALDRGILWSDPRIGISWPIRNPILSPKDASLPPLEAADNNFEYEAKG